MPRELASAASAWGDSEPERSSLEPVSVRRHFKSRYAAVTFARRWAMRVAEKRPIIHAPPRRERESRPRPRRARRAGASRDGPSRLAEDEPEPDLSAALLSGGAV
jgi:hypothetical protein